MAKDSRMFIVDYRVTKDDFKATVESFKKMLVDKEPIEVSAWLTIFKVFTVNLDDRKVTYQAQLRVTGLAAGSPGLKHSPAIYWGSDTVSSDFKQLEGLALPGMNEPLTLDPAGQHESQIGSVVSLVGYRMGVVNNPNYPGRKVGRSLALLLAGAGALIAAQALFARHGHR